MEHKLLEAFLHENGYPDSHVLNHRLNTNSVYVNYKFINTRDIFNMEIDLFEILAFVYSKIKN